MVREEAKELLNDFIEELKIYRLIGDVEDIRDDFLDSKFNNSAQSEALSIGNNEQAKEDFEESFVDYMERTYDWDEDGDTPRQMFNSFLKSLTNKSD